MILRNLTSGGEEKVLIDIIRSGLISDKKMKIRKSRRYYTKKYLTISRYIDKVSKEEQLPIIKEMIEDAHRQNEITSNEKQKLLAKLLNRAKKIGEQKFIIKAGPLGEYGFEKKG